MSKILALTVLLLGDTACAQSPVATAHETDQAIKTNQASAQQLLPEQKAVWKGEQNYFRYLPAKDLKGFMSLWDDNFLGWPDYNEHPLRKPEIASGVAEEFRRPQSSVRPIPAPKTEAVAMFGRLAMSRNEERIFAGSKLKTAAMRFQTEGSAIRDSIF